MLETAADVYQGSAEEGTRGTAPRVREKTYSKEELDAAEAFKKMCSTLGPHGLASASKGDGSALISTFAKTLESLSVREAKTPDAVTPKELGGLRFSKE